MVSIKTMLGQLKKKDIANEDGKKIKPLNAIQFALLSVPLGILTGLGAVAFRGLIAFFHNLLMSGQISFYYDANAHTPSSYLGPLVILVPVLGAVGVSFLVKNFAPEAKGHGVPEVIDAVYYNKGKIRPVVALVKSLASALSIGSGGSVGREGPIIQIGSSLGSSISQILPIPAWQRITLVAAGAGAGIAATFNTPVGGVLFALEIIVHEVSVRTIVPIALATATGTYIGRLFFGSHPSFIIPNFETPYFQITQPEVLIAYIGLGVLAGIVSVIFIRSIYWMEDLFDKHIKNSYYVRHMVGMLLVGVIMFVLLISTGHYYVGGVGYATIQDILMSTLLNPYLLVTLLVLKLLATALTLGSGASGGIFSPGLFLGATLGSLYGLLMHYIFPALEIAPSAFAVAGMAAIVGGSTGAAMTAIVMIFEMTLDYNIILPLTIVVVVSYEIRKILCSESIYTLKLTRRGHIIPDAMRKNIHDNLRVDQIMSRPVNQISLSTTFSDIVKSSHKNGHSTYFIVNDEHNIMGIIANETISVFKEPVLQDTPISEMLNSNIINKSYTIVDSASSYLDVLQKMYRKKVSNALVVDKMDGDPANHVIGIVTEQMITHVVEDNADLFSDK